MFDTNIRVFLHGLQASGVQKLVTDIFFVGQVTWMIMIIAAAEYYHPSIQEFIFCKGKSINVDLSVFLYI